MIQVILKDKTNPYRAEDKVFETTSSSKAAIFIKALKEILIYNEWEIKTIIGGVE